MIILDDGVRIFGVLLKNALNKAFWVNLSWSCSSRDDYFVLKPKHSAFYQTNLEILLQYLGVNTLIMTGMASDICVLFSANDAYMRGFRLIIPSDCTASEESEQNEQVLELMCRVLKADVTRSTKIAFDGTRVAKS
jgi:nicotinamidase-related amidase